MNAAQATAHSSRPLPGTRTPARWCICVLAVLMPGSFEVFALLLVIRYVARRSPRVRVLLQRWLPGSTWWTPLACEESGEEWFFHPTEVHK